MTVELSDQTLLDTTKRTVGNLAAAVQDIVAGWHRRELWLYLGWKDIRLRYSRTILGPFWQTLSVAIFVGALGFVFINFWNTTVDEYLPFLAAGVVTWNFITFCLTEGCSTFTGASVFIKQVKLPLPIYAYQLVYRNILVLLHSLPVLVFINLYFGKSMGMPLLALPFSMVILALNGFFMALFFGVLAARFRDIQNFVGNILVALFFITPIHWMPHLVVGRRTFVVNWNPFHHMIEIFRAPLLGEWPSALTWYACIGITLFNGLLALYVYGRYRSRISYWL